MFESDIESIAKEFDLAISDYEECDVWGLVEVRFSIGDYDFYIDRDTVGEFGIEDAVRNAIKEAIMEEKI